MTAQEFVKKYPDADYNENCLENIACPKCGYRDRFLITATTQFTMTDNGEDDHSDIDYDKSSFAICEKCHHGDKLSEFTIEGLDDLLSQPTCDYCGERYPDAGDGWCGSCPSCADKMEPK